MTKFVTKHDQIGKNGGLIWLPNSLHNTTKLVTKHLSSNLSHVISLVIVTNLIMLRYKFCHVLCYQFGPLW